MTKVKIQMMLFSIIILSSAMLSQAAEMSTPFTVASDVKETRSQTWASIAWAEEAKCWLVVWREGFLNEAVSDIFCARISADGKAMDPEGIRISSGKEVKDRPRVASDGKNFMVIWEDFRNGKDWDVYAARVSGKGVLLDAEPILVAGGDHNQARPDIAFSKGNYCVLWMAFTDMYDIYGTRLSSEGKVLGEKPVDVYIYDRSGKKKRKGRQGVLPVLATNKKGEILSSCFNLFDYRRRCLARQAIDPETGGPLGPQATKVTGLGDKNTPGMFGFFRDRRAGLALGPNGAISVYSSRTAHQSKLDISVCRYTKSGEVIGMQELGSSLTSNSNFKPIQSRNAVAFDGKMYLAVSECLHAVKKKRDVVVRTARVIGWRLSEDGVAENPDGFMIAGDTGFECILPATAAGPDGVCLIVYTEVRGVDDVKILARVIR